MKTPPPIRVGKGFSTHTVPPHRDATATELRAPRENDLLSPTLSSKGGKGNRTVRLCETTVHGHNALLERLEAPHEPVGGCNRIGLLSPTLSSKGGEGGDVQLSKSTNTVLTHLLHEPQSKKDPSPLIPLPVGPGEGDAFLRATFYKHGATNVASPRAHKEKGRI